MCLAVHTPGMWLGKQASPDLAQWQPIGTATANTGCQFEFEDPAPLPSESRFYRVVFP